MVDALEIVGARQLVAQCVVENGQRHRVALLEHEVSETGGKGFGVVQLCQLARAVVHGLAAIDQQVSDEVSVLLVLLDVVAVTAPKHLPVKMARVVARRVFPVLGELDGKSAQGRTMLPHAVAFDDAPRDETEVFRSGDRGGIEEIGMSGGDGHGVVG